MQCPSCFAVVPAESRFCLACGQPFGTLAPILSPRLLVTTEPWLILAVAFVGNIVLVSVLMRFGFVTLAVVAYVLIVVSTFPLTFDASTWDAGFG